MNPFVKKAFSALLLCTAFSGLHAKIGTWTDKASLSVSRSNHVAFSIADKGYICAGADAGSNILKDLWQYDPATNTWAQKADMPGAGRLDASGFAVGAYGYVGLGWHTGTRECFYSFNRYNPANNSWTAISDCPVKRYTAGGFAIGNLGYITCGLYPGGPRYKDLWSYNPATDTWTEKASLPSGALDRAFPCVVSNGSKAYLMGGYDGSTIANDFHEYDPVSDQWTSKATYPYGARSYATGFALGRYIVIGMGRSSRNQDEKDWHYYDPSNNTWYAAEDHPDSNTVGCASFAIGGKGYVCGGWSVRSGAVMGKVTEFSAPSLSIGEKPIASASALNAWFAAGSHTLHCAYIAGDFDIQICDMNGKQVYATEFRSAHSEQLALNLSHLNSGVYVAHIRHAGLYASLKLIVD